MTIVFGSLPWTCTCDKTTQTTQTTQFIYVDLICLPFLSQWPYREGVL